MKGSRGPSWGVGSRREAPEREIARPSSAFDDGISFGRALADAEIWTHRLSG